MRPWRRRRPAGRPQVPIPPPPSPVVPLGPAVVRLSVDRVVIDAPWDRPLVGLSNVWIDEGQPASWRRAAWPQDPRSGLLVAPVDLRVGHAVAVLFADGSTVYGWVADVDPRRFVLGHAADAWSAVRAAHRAVQLWHDAEVDAVRRRWDERMDRDRDR